MHEKKRFAGIEAEIASLREELAMLKLVNSTYHPERTIEAIAAKQIEHQLGPTQIVGSKPTVESSWFPFNFIPATVQESPQPQEAKEAPEKSNPLLEEYQAAKARREEADQGLSEANQEQHALETKQTKSKEAAASLGGLLPAGVGTSSHPASVLGLDAQGKPCYSAFKKEAELT